MAGSVRQFFAAFVWIGLSACAWWTQPAAAENIGVLPTIECRLEHPLHLTSIAAHCGILRVPLDREHPKEGSIDLKVAIVPALNRRSTAAPLFLLAGGPGQSAMQVYVALNSAFARINRNHAIVLLDQRGTGISNQQSCVYPEDWQEPDDPIPALRQATVECLAKLGPQVRFYTPASRFAIWTMCARCWATTRSTCTAAPTAHASPNTTCGATRRTSTR